MVSPSSPPTQTPSEISPPPPPPPPPIRHTKPGTKRLILTLSVLSSFLFGLPFLLKSTEIYRSPLPFSSIDSLVHSPPPRIHFHALFLGFSAPPHPSSLHRLLSQHILSLSSSNFTLSVSLDPSHLQGVDWTDTDEALDEILEARLGAQEVGSGACSVVLVRREGEEKPRVVVGKHRHGWIVGAVSEVEAVSFAGKVFVEVFMNGGKGEGKMRESAEFMPVGADGSVVLSFSLLNSDPNDWVYDWDFRFMDEILLAPVVETLAPIAEIDVESQVLYHTPKSSLSSWDEKLASYTFGTKDLPFFVNSNEWHLDTSIAATGRSKVLQFVVYVPSANECPLLLQLPSGDISATNAFISPMWGGVVVWNPPICSGAFNVTDVTKHRISREDLQKIFKILMGQLRQLLGLKSDNLLEPESGISKFLGNDRGFAEWELDLLYRHHTCFNLQSCATTLGSLSKLVQSLPRMIVMDEIGKQVKFSLEAATLAQNKASDGVYNSSVVSSRHARALAEDAFFHPSIMSLSYYSFEHYLAVYMPYFAPVALHVLLAAIKELKRYKQERAKYLSWVAQATS